MAGVAIRLNLKKSKRVQDELRRIMNRIDDLRPLNEGLAKYMLTDTRRRFSTKVSPDGTHWAPLTRTTEELKARIGAMSDIHSDMFYMPDDALIASGGLKASLRVGYVGKSEFEVRAGGEGADHASAMQFGVAETSGMIPGRTVPARPFLGFSSANRKTIMRKIHEYIEKEGV